MNSATKSCNWTVKYCADGTVCWLCAEGMCYCELFLFGQVCVGLDDLLDMDSDCDALAGPRSFNEESWQ